MAKLAIFGKIGYFSGRVIKASFRQNWQVLAKLAIIGKIENLWHNWQYLAKLAIFLVE